MGQGMGPRLCISRQLPVGMDAAGGGGGGVWSVLEYQGLNASGF